MLKDLQSSLSKHHIAVPSGKIDQAKIFRDITKDVDTQREEQLRLSREIRDTDAACNIVSHIFHSIDMCLKEDKSKVKLSLFAKSFIKGVLTNTVKTGIDDFIKNMNDQDIRNLLDDIQRELDKRK
jgi:methionine salvage enolase-phosphatase E1